MQLVDTFLEGLFEFHLRVLPLTDVVSFDAVTTFFFGLKKETYTLNLFSNTIPKSLFR